MIQRLYMRIYLTTLASLAVVVILTALVWQFTAERVADAQQDRFIAALVGAALPANVGSATGQETLARVVVPPIAGLVLYAPDGVRIAGAGNEAGIGGHSSFSSHSGYVLRKIRLDDGRIILARMDSGSMHRHLGGLALTALIALAVALGTYPVIRQLTRRLEGLAGSVDRFGQGDLTARAAISGQDEVSRLAATFNAMADRVGSLLDAHRRMLVNASHELRSPLARVRMGLELYATDPRPDLLQGMRHDCAEIDDQ
ncbi:MAG: sensor histidine kinase, partial [Xanthomonadaceae bacterium]|nr:sensor histidine kinase [Xanthomonadaceae bacterium]